MTEAIFWDNDGVLVDTEHLYFEATRRVLSTVGIELTETDYRDLFLVRNTGAWHLAAARGIDAARIEALKAARNALYATRLAEAPRLIPGVRETLLALHGRFAMGIVTSSRGDHFEVIHRETGVLNYFDFVITADDCPRTKPCPDPYLRAIERSGRSPDVCIAIEDSARGLEAAIAAGLRCIIIPSRLTAGQQFSGALAVLRNVSEVPECLRALRVSANPQILKS
jgi:HAD superfamily hydrolase (TIGR01509 family)